MRNNNSLSIYFIFYAAVALTLFLPSLSSAEGYSYDNAGRLTGVTYDDNSSITYTYDNAGNILQQTIGANSPPNDFALVYPADGATDVLASIPLIWKQTTDPDGDPVSYQVTYCEDMALTINCSAQTVVLNTRNTFLYASIAGPFSGLFLLGMVFTGSAKTRLRKQLAFIAILVFISGLVACGGGGGSSAPAAPAGPTLPTAAADEKQLNINGLAPATTYFWKVTANDGLGGSMDSTTSSFTTK